MEYSILGYAQECNCDHCGRNLKVGIQLSNFGTIGADCLNAALTFDRNRWGGGKPGASYLRDMAIKRQKYSAERLKDMGYYPTAFSMNVKDGALNLS